MTRKELLLKIRELESLVEFEEQSSINSNPATKYALGKKKQVCGDVPEALYHKLRNASILMRIPFHYILAEAIENHIELMQEQLGKTIDGTTSGRLQSGKSSHVDKELKMFKNAVKSLELKWAEIE